MASRRQELSQRRKAVGFTQESLAEHLGVERSTVIRWEAGDSEPLPSIRPNLARALQVSIDQLAELLTRSEFAGTTRTLSADLEVTIPAQLPEVQPPGQPEEVELENLIRPQIAETVEALRRALQSTGVSAEDLVAMLLVGGSSQVPLVAPGLDISESPRTEPPNTSSLRRARSRRCKRLVIAGACALALPAVWLSAPFVTSHGSALPQVAAGSQEHAIPVGPIPAPNLGADHDNSASSADSTGAGPLEPLAKPDTPAAGGPAQPAVDTVPASHTTSVPGKSRTAIPTAATSHPPLSATQAWMIAAAKAGHRWDGVDQVARADHPW